MYTYIYIAFFSFVCNDSFIRVPRLFYVYAMPYSYVCVAVCCSVLQRVAVCCSVLQCVAVCCSVLQRVAVCCSVPSRSFAVTYSYVCHGLFMCVPCLIHMYVLQYVAVCCSVLQYVAVCCSVLCLIHMCAIILMTWLVHMWDMNETCLVHMCDMTRLDGWHDSFICVTWLIHMCDMTHSYVWHDLFKYEAWASQASFICVTWLVHMCDTTRSDVWHDSSICLAWRIHICDVTHSYVWHDLFIRGDHGSFICVTRRIHRCDMTHSHVWLIYISAVIQSIRDTTHTYLCACIENVRRDSFVCVNECRTWLIRRMSTSMQDTTHSYLWRKTWLIHMCDMTHSSYEYINVWHDSFISVT